MRQLGLLATALLLLISSSTDFGGPLCYNSVFEDWSEIDRTTGPVAWQGRTENANAKISSLIVASTTDTHPSILTYHSLEHVQQLKEQYGILTAFSVH